MSTASSRGSASSTPSRTAGDPPIDEFRPMPAVQPRPRAYAGDAVHARAAPSTSIVTRKLIEFHIGNGADALALPMHAGESVSLPDGERRDAAAHLRSNA